MTSKFYYLIVLEINFVDPKNLDDYEGEIPQKLRDLLDHKEERCIIPIMEETLMIKLGTKEDPQMV